MKTQLIGRLARWLKALLGENARSPRPRAGGTPSVEGLERREVLSTAAVHPFMTVPAKLDTAADTSASVEFRLDPGAFTAGRGRSTILLGLNTRPAPGSAATTRVNGLDGPTGSLIARSGSTGDPFLVTVRVPVGGADVYTARVANEGVREGGFGLDGFLAGDVNGDLKVTHKDVDRVLAAFGQRSGDARYDEAADINHDGRVGKLDYRITIQNMGAKASFIRTTLPVTVTPATTAPVSLPVTVPTTPVATTTAPATNVVLVQAASTAPAQTVTWTPQTPTYYPTTQYGVVVPAGAIYGSVPTASAPAVGYYAAPPQSIPTYSYTPTASTPVYIATSR